MYHIASPRSVLDDDEILEEIRKEREQLASELKALRRQYSEIRRAIAAKKKSLRRNAILEKFRKKSLGGEA